MSRNRLAKQSPIEMKKRMIQTRKETYFDEAAKPQPTQFYKLQQQNQTSLKSAQKQLAFTFVPPSPRDNLRNSQKSQNQYRQRSSTGRLKLKDYLHLNSLERKSKEKKNRSSSTYLNNTQSSRLSFKKESESQKKQKEKSQLQKARNNENVLRKQIAAKIETEIVKLNQIKEYLSVDFCSKQKPSQTFVYLFQLYNSLLQVQNIDKKIGNLIVNYESSKEEPQNNDQLKQPYFWAQRHPQKDQKNHALLDQLQKSKNVN